MITNHMVRQGPRGDRYPGQPCGNRQHSRYEWQPPEPLPRAAYAVPQVDQDWRDDQYLILAAMYAAKQAQRSN